MATFEQHLLRIIAERRRQGKSTAFSREIEQKALNRKLRRFNMLCEEYALERGIGMREWMR